MIGARNNFDKVRGDWFDVVRPTKLMAYKNEYGADGDSSCSVRQPWIQELFSYFKRRI
jgi:hypothetical protein